MGRSRRPCQGRRRQAEAVAGDKNRPAGSTGRPRRRSEADLRRRPEDRRHLHTLGIFTFAQVALEEGEREWVDGYLLPGRIDRDDWVKQAKALAKGGVAEYIRVSARSRSEGEKCFRTKTASSPTSTASSTSRWRARWRAATGTTRRHHRQGPRLDRQRDEGVGPARPWRRRLPDRSQMVVHAQAERRPAELSRRQCRRIRARHLQGPRHPAPRSAHAGRGLPDRRLRHGRGCRLHLCARRVHPRARGAAARHRRGL